MGPACYAGSLGINARYLMAVHEDDVLHVDGDGVLPRGALVLHRAAVHQPVRRPLQADGAVRLAGWLGRQRRVRRRVAVDDDGARRRQRQLAAAAAVAVSGSGAVLRQYLWIIERTLDYSTVQRNFFNSSNLEQEIRRL